MEGTLRNRPFPIKLSSANFSIHWWIKSESIIIQIIPSTFISWHATIRKSFLFPLLYICRYACLYIFICILVLFSELKSFAFIIYSGTQTVWDLVSRSPFRLTTLSFWHKPVPLYMLFNFLIQWGISGSFYTFPAPVIEPATLQGTLVLFSKNCAQKLLGLVPPHSPSSSNTAISGVRGL